MKELSIEQHMVFVKNENLVCSKCYKPFVRASKYFISNYNYVLVCACQMIGFYRLQPGGKKPSTTSYLVRKLYAAGMCHVDQGLT